MQGASTLQIRVEDGQSYGSLSLGKMALLGRLWQTQQGSVSVTSHPTLCLQCCVEDMVRVHLAGWVGASDDWSQLQGLGWGCCQSWSSFRHFWGHDFKGALFFLEIALTYKISLRVEECEGVDGDVFLIKKKKNPAKVTKCMCV